MRFAGLSTVLRLVVAHVLAHPGRLVFTVLSTILSAAVVVWIVSGYDALVNKFDDFAEGYLGRYELILVPAKTVQFGGFGPPGGGAELPSSLVARLKEDPNLAAVEPVIQVRARIVKAGAAAQDETAEQANREPDRRASRAQPPGSEPKAAGADAPQSGAISAAQTAQMMSRFARQPTLVGTEASQPPHALISGRWIDLARTEPAEGVMTRASAEMLGVELDDEVIAGYGREGRELHVKIVGISEQPKTLPPPKFMVGLPPTRDAALRRGPANSALYVARGVAEQIAGGSVSPSYVGLHLQPGVNPATVQARWARELAALEPAAELQSLANVESEVDNSTTVEVVRTQALSATGIALLAALFIIYTTLSMGVSERIRQFAVLRAVALTKAHIIGIIAIESLALGMIGWGGGLLAGWTLLRFMSETSPGTSGENAALGSWCIILSGLCSLGGSLTAAIIPAWQATRVSPLDAMSPRRRLKDGGLSWWATLMGLVLIGLNPVLVFYVPMADTARYAWSVSIGCTAMALGFVLLAPAAVVLCERVFGRIVARLLRIPYDLLATQLTTNLWRTVGTSVSLTLGLGLFVAMQTWGYSMLGPFTPGSWVPEMLVIMGPTGVPDSEIEAVRNAHGVNPAQFVPVAARQVKLADDVTGYETRASATRQDTCVMVGVDPVKGVAGPHPLFPWHFVAGSRDDAVAKLGQGRFCLVPDHFARESGLGVGDKFTVLVPAKNSTNERVRGRRGGNAPRDARQAGTQPDKTEANRIEYEIAGVVSMPGWHWMTKQGFRQGRAAGLMFADFDQVRRDFAIERTTLFWMNLTKDANEDSMKASLQAIAARNDDAKSQPAFGNAGGDGRGFRRTAGPTVTLKSAESVRTQIRERADGIIWALSQLPLITLAVTSLSVINAVLASIRARRWELGVLRALGVTRFGLMRLILAEALLVGVVGCLLSMGFGVMAGYCGTGVTRYINIRGGMITPLVVPWLQITIGFACTLGLCFLAALWPAFSTGRTEPLRLLQAGRSAL